MIDFADRKIEWELVKGSNKRQNKERVYLQGKVHWKIDKDKKDFIYKKLNEDNIKRIFFMDYQDLLKLCEEFHGEISSAKHCRVYFSFPEKNEKFLDILNSKLLLKAL